MPERNLNQDDTFEDFDPRPTTTTPLSWHIVSRPTPRRWASASSRGFCPDSAAKRDAHVAATAQNLRRMAKRLYS